MRLFLLAAAALFVIAGLVASFPQINIAISALAWVAWGLLALTLDLLFGGWSVAVPVGPRRQQPPPQV